MIRLGVDWRPHRKELNRRWFWDSWKKTPLTHVYDPITGKLLMVNGVRYKEGDPSECAPFNQGWQRWTQTHSPSHSPSRE